jgi:hypothetical protein
MPFAVYPRRLLPDETRIIVFGVIAGAFRIREKSLGRLFEKSFKSVVWFSSEGISYRKRQNLFIPTGKAGGFPNCTASERQPMFLKGFD